jgi:2-oxo-4-hydroxy-4-carboxy--5-ureidoimidazoline (OHCU) decarboxylase
VLRDRLGNDPETEWDVVRTELSKINALRLAKLLDA